MNINKAKELHSQLGMTQWYELCNDWLDETDILFALKQKPSMIPELAFQGMC